MKKTVSIFLILLGIVISIQFVHPEKLSDTPTEDLAGVPAEVNNILRKSCFDCHSSQSDLHWYDRLTPANFFVYRHIREGRKVLDFSKWDSVATPAQNNILYYSLNKILEEEMPLPSYTMVHKNAKLNPTDIEILKKYTLSRTPRKTTDTSVINTADKEYTRFIQGEITAGNVKPTSNGIAYIPDYRSWKVISTSDRFDNGTMRIIFANDVAVKAIQNHQTQNWPDGTIIAKAAWKAQVKADGQISIGQFFQVEFMIKDVKKYAKTAGWGWARWRGSDLKPYGANSMFTTECTSCHKPMKDNDYMFTKPLDLFTQFKKKN